MIVFDLRCPAGHVFEGWFASSAAWEDQVAARQVACAICGDRRIEKAVMAPAVAPKGNQAPVPSPATLKQAMQRLATQQAKLLETSEWVGASFASRARAMHNGEEDRATIHGQATREEAKALVEEGVPVAALPMPVVPPDQVN